MGGGRPHELREHLFKPETQVLKSRAEHLVCLTSLVQRVGPGVDEGAYGLEPSAVGDRYLEFVCWPTPPNSEHPHPVGTIRRELDRREVSDHVRSDVRVRIAHLIDELLGDSRYRHTAARSGVLRHDESTVRRRLDNWIADVREIRNVAPIVQTIATRTLGAALDDMSGDDPGREHVPVFGSPTELEPNWRHGERGVR